MIVLKGIKDDTLLQRYKYANFLTLQFQPTVAEVYGGAED